jgi:hypothetical protein
MQGETTIDALIKGGLIGAFIGAVLLKDKEEGAFIGALLGAVISATQKANEEAQKTNVDVIVEEDGNLFRIEPSGQKHFIRKLKKPNRSFPESFQL